MIVECRMPLRTVLFEVSRIVCDVAERTVQSDDRTGIGHISPVDSGMCLHVVVFQAGHCPLPVRLARLEAARVWSRMCEDMICPDLSIMCRVLGERDTTKRAQFVTTTSSVMGWFDLGQCGAYNATTVSNEGSYGWILAMISFLRWRIVAIRRSVNFRSS